MNNVEIEVSAKNATGDGFEAAKQGLRELSREATEAGKKSGAGFMESIGERFGRGSEFTHVAHLLEGGGMAIGIGLAAREMKELTEHAALLSDEMIKGDKSAGELADDFAKSIPVIGSVYDSMASIAEILTGNKAINDLITRGADEQNKAIESRLKQLDDERDAHEKILKVIEKENAARGLIGLSGDQKTNAEGGNTAAERRQKLTDDADAADKKRHDDLAKHRLDLAKEANDLQASMGSPGFWSQAGLVVANPVIGGAIAAGRKHAADEANKEKQSQIDRINSELKGSARQDADAEKQAAKDRHDALAADAALAAREEQQRQADENEARKQRTEKGEQEIARARDEARADELKSQGKDYDAEILMMRSHLRDRQAAIEDGRQKAVKDHPEDAQTINQQAAQKSGLAAAGELSDEDDARKKHDQDLADKRESALKDQAQAGEKIAAAEAKLKSDELRDAGKFFEADKVMRDERLKDVLDGIQKEEEARLKAHPEFREDILKQAATESALAQADSTEDERRAKMKDESLSNSRLRDAAFARTSQQGIFTGVAEASQMRGQHGKDDQHAKATAENTKQMIDILKNVAKELADSILV